MKRFCAVMLVFVLLCASMTGCGMDRGRRDTMPGTPTVSPEVLPDTSPLPTPDVENGIIEDEDGKIEEPDMQTPQVSSVPTASPKISTSPEVSTKP